jgi:hypothetical protein
VAVLAAQSCFIAPGLQHWLRRPYFAGVRELDSLGRLPEAERQAWQRLWADVADTLTRAREQPFGNSRPAASSRHPPGQ